MSDRRARSWFPSQTFGHRHILDQSRCQNTICAKISRSILGVVLSPSINSIALAIDRYRVPRRSAAPTRFKRPIKRPLHRGGVCGHVRLDLACEAPQARERARGVEHHVFHTGGTQCLELRHDLVGRADQRALSLLLRRVGIGENVRATRSAWRSATRTACAHAPGCCARSRPPSHARCPRRTYPAPRQPAWDRSGGRTPRLPPRTVRCARTTLTSRRIDRG